MKVDRQIKLSIGNSRRSMNWQPVTLLVSEFWDKLKIPMRSKETLAEYMTMKKTQQDDLKDSAGGFVGGSLNSPRRKANNVTGRDLITLDLDNIPAGGTDDILRRVEALGCGYCVYSTRKHQPAAPRLRILLPLDRTVTAEEYEPIARKMAELIGLEFADPTTFDCARLFYFPTCCRDSEYIYRVGDKGFVSADGILAQYANWHDMTTWPAIPGQQAFTKQAVKQGDPEAKNGIVGAFCRTYDIYRAIEELLPGIYEPVDAMPGRYTYMGGSTTGGAVLYDSGKFLYSHHATDPCGGKLVNAFDLVRMHKFGDKDDEAQPGTPTSRLPSYNAMCKFAAELPEVSALIAREDFADTGNGDDQSLDWTSQLTLATDGGYHKTINNTMLILQNLPALHGCARKDDFSGRVYAAEELPWAKGVRVWSDADTTELRRYLEQEHRFKPGKSDIRDAVIAVAVRQRFHPVRDYLNSLLWDLKPRLDTLFVDYLGAEDTPYIRAITRKALVGAVARIMEPGCKFDYMPVLVGGQGRGKSSIISKLAGGNDWFSDSVTTFDGKNAFEAITGKWLIEIPEMQAFDKATMNQAKAFITKQSDFYRAAYAEFPEDRGRQCVFFGTTNDHDCLRDATGGRRFWPVDIDAIDRKKDIFVDLPIERDQIWAEAVIRWHTGEPLHLQKNLEEEAAIEQESHREAHPWEGTIENFLESEIPEDWDAWDLIRRTSFWDGTVTGDHRLIKRTKVCVREIWQEAFRKDVALLDTQKSRAIASVINHTGAWERKGNMWFGKVYGTQKGFVRRSNPSRLKT